MVTATGGPGGPWLQPQTIVKPTQIPARTARENRLCIFLRHTNIGDEVKKTQSFLPAEAPRLFLFKNTPKTSSPSRKIIFGVTIIGDLLPNLSSVSCRVEGAEFARGINSREDGVMNSNKFFRWGSVNVRLRWFWSIRASTCRSRLRWSPLRARSAARARRCGTGCGRRTATRGCGLARRARSGSGSRLWSGRSGNRGRPVTSCARRARILLKKELDRRFKPRAH